MNPNYHKEYSKKWRKKNPEKRAIQQKNYRETHQNKEYMSCWQKENVDKCNLNSLNYKIKNQEKVKKYNKLWKLNNKDKVLAQGAYRRAKKLQATPKWLTELHILEIEQFYSDAQETAWLNEDCKPHHVDHIVPLVSDIVCGLHVPWNLQLLIGKVNLSKNNKLIKF